MLHYISVKFPELSEGIFYPIYKGLLFFVIGIFLSRIKKITNVIGKKHKINEKELKSTSKPPCDNNHYGNKDTTKVPPPARQLAVLCVL